MSYIHCPNYPYDHSIRDMEAEGQGHLITCPGPLNYGISTYRDGNPSLVLSAHALENNTFLPLTKN